MTRRMIWAAVVAGLQVLTSTLPSQAGWPLFGGHCGSGCSRGPSCCAPRCNIGCGRRTCGRPGCGMQYGSMPMSADCCGSDMGGMPMEPGMLIPPAGMPGGMPTALLNGGAASNVMVSTDGVPGTLGLTYQVPSRRIPADKHPRIGQVVISVDQGTFDSLAEGEEVKVTVADNAGHFVELEGYFGTDDKWHFDSKPLYMTIPNIYDASFEVVRMEKRKERKGDKVIEWEVEKQVRELGVRRFRMIPGREVKLSFP